MAPVVHGLEQEYAGVVDFLYLNIAEERNSDAKRTYGFTSTPHFVFLRADGFPMKSMQGVLPIDSLRRSLGALLQSARPLPSR